jgi:hypothetical protein
LDVLSTNNYTMKERTTRTVKEQAWSGLRLGIGFAGFLLGGVLLGIGLNGLVWSATPPHTIMWSNVIAWLEIVVAAAILFASAPIWWQLLAGYMVLGTLKSLFVLATGTDVYAPNEHFSRGVAALFTCYGVLMLALLWRFVKHELTIPDRLALVLALIFFLWTNGAAEFSTLAPGLIAGPLALGITYLVAEGAGKGRPKTTIRSF